MMLHADKMYKVHTAVISTHAVNKNHLRPKASTSNANLFHAINFS